MMLAVIASTNPTSMTIDWLGLWLGLELGIGIGIGLDIGLRLELGLGLGLTPVATKYTRTHTKSATVKHCTFFYCRPMIFQAWQGAPLVQPQQYDPKYPKDTANEECGTIVAEVLEQDICCFCELQKEEEKLF